MSITLFNQYGATKVDAPDADYPGGKPRNVTAPGAGDGTPYEAAWFKDLTALMQGLLYRANITASETVDTVTASQYLDALEALHGITLPATTDALTLSLAAYDYFTSSGYSAAGDNGGAAWVATGGAPGTPGTTDYANGLLYDADGKEFELASTAYTFEALGLEYQNAIDFCSAKKRTIVLPEGAAYAIGAVNLTIGDGVRIIGPGKFNSGPVAAVLDFTGITGDAITITGDNVTLRGFNVSSDDDGVLLSGGLYGVFKELNIAAVNTCWESTSGARQSVFDSVQFGSSTDRGYKAAGCEAVHINCWYDSSFAGIQLQGPAGHVFISPWIINNTTGVETSGLTATVIFDRPYFLGNSGADVSSAPGAGAVNPWFYNVQHAKGDTGTDSFILGADGGGIQGLVSAGVAAADTVINLDGNGVQVSGARIEQATGVTCVGIQVGGNDNEIKNITFVADSAVMLCIQVDAGAKRTRVAGLRYESVDTTTSAPMTDAGDDTQFTDAFIHTFRTMAADLVSEVDGVYINRAGYLNRAWAVWPGGTGGAPAGNILCGRDATLGYFFTQAIPTSQPAWTKVQITTLSANDLGSTNVLSAAGDASGSASNDFILTVEVTPYPALT